MEIKDVQPNTGKVSLTAEVVDKEEPRTFKKFGKEGKVCNLRIKDQSGEIVLTLWNEDIEKVSVGDVVRLHNGWGSEFKGEKQLSTGKFGKLEIVEKGEAKTIFTNDPAALGGQLGGMETEESPSADDQGEAVDEEFLEE